MKEKHENVCNILSHLATAAFATEYVYPADRVTKRSVYRSP